jgi:S1-C subfamily serine protease
MRNVRLALVLAATALASSVEVGAFAQQPPREPAQPRDASAPLQASQAEARRLSDAFVSAAEKVSPSVVQVEVTTRDESAEQILRWLGRRGDAPVARGTGSGLVMSPDGAVLTNNHVIEDALTMNVRLRDGRLLPAKLVGRDPATDLALLRVEATGLQAARLADSDAVRVGEWVVAIGSPFGLGYTVTSGVVSAKGRGLGLNAIEDYVQTDASINPGNSGGPLCDLEGRVVGINTMIVGRGSGIGFAVPANLAKRVAEQLVRTGKVERATLGLGHQDLTPELASAMQLDPRAGVLVNSVADGGPAGRANIRPGDVIAAVGGKPVRDGRELVREVLARDVGQTVALEILRGGKRYATSAVLVARAEAPIPPLPVQQQGAPQAGLGVSVRDLTSQQAQSLGLPAKAVAIVAQVAPGSAADRAGLKAGDTIVEADGLADPNAQQVAEASKDGQLLLRLRRRDATFYAALKK